MATEFNYKGYTILVSAEPHHIRWGILNDGGHPHCASVALTIDGMTHAPRQLLNCGGYFDSDESATVAGRAFGEKWVNDLLAMRQAA